MFVQRLEGGPFSYAPFRRIIFARALSTIGSWMQTVGAGWLVFHLTGNAMDVGILAAIALGPSLVGSPIGGALADRFCPRHLAIGFTCFLILPPLTMSLLAFNDALTVPLIYLLVFCGAVPHSINQPIIQLVIPFTVPAELRGAAVADVSAVYNLAQFTGAILGGTVVATVGVGLSFAANAASYAVVALVFVGSPILQAACDAARNHRDSSIRRGLKEGWPLSVVRTVAFGGAAFFVIVAPIEQLMPVIAGDHGESAMLLGVLLGALCAGALLASPFVRRWITDGVSAERTLSFGVVVSATGTLLLGISSSLVTDIPLLMLIGFSWEMVFVSGGSAVQLDVPADIRGRMVGLFYLLVTGSSALGALLIGYIFSQIGVEASLIVGGAVSLLFGILLVLRLRRHGARIATP